MISESEDILQRRARAIAPAVAAGITEEVIHDLVHGFYAEVRDDPLIGPIFEERISDWDSHLETMCDFWSGVMLMTGRFKGAPMPKHMVLPVNRLHFARWLALFVSTARQVATAEAAEMFSDRAHRIAESFQLGIAHYRGEAPQRIGRPVGANA
ncbi:group III truncated hemoglobin [Sphingomonas flavalba]|uniref:group III truncated hemoglobin n=1 Tax=Sphingomonas flavalba TaxID=2559804 RepID=UPI0039E119A2